MNILKALSLAVLGTVLSVAGAQAQTKDWSKIKIATEGAYAPWNFQEGGKLVGFEVDLANELCKRMKATCEVVAQDWDGIIPALNAGKYDAIMAGMNITPKRMEAIQFSAPYAATPHGFGVLKSSPLAKLPGGDLRFNLATDEAGAAKAAEAMKPLLKGKVIGAQVSTINADFVNKYFKDVAEIREYKTTEQHDLDLAAGRLDAIFVGHGALVATMDKPDFKDVTMAGPAFRGGLLGAGVGVGIRKADAELKAKFDEAIKATIADGTMKTLSMKWFKIDAVPQT
ncbi:MAG TPA: transporter substrate-binding domain-containing protein [Beijerinckiaceae bacterium]|jgi:octopine/nopaline transport system substrate-binding protein